MSHFIDYGAPLVGRSRARALCGSLVGSHEHDASPTCAECRQQLAEDDASILSLQQTQQPAPVGPPEKPDDRRYWGGLVKGAR